MDNWAERATTSNGDQVEMGDFNNYNPYFGNGFIPAPIVNGNGEQFFQMGSNGLGNGAFSSMSPNTQAVANETTFLGTNDDLNSFFPTPNKEVGGFRNPGMTQGQWDNGDPAQMFGHQGFPFPQQIPQQPLPAVPFQPKLIVPSEIQQPTDILNSGDSAIEPSDARSEASEDLPKPKRGRPRKRKEKQPPTKEEINKKRVAFLERNRRAASKCRKRKKESTANIQNKASMLEQTVNNLRMDLAQVKACYEYYLAIAVTHASVCPDSNALQKVIDSALQRGFVPSRSPSLPNSMGVVVPNVPGPPSVAAPSPSDSNGYAELFAGSEGLVMMSRGPSQQSIQSFESQQSIHSAMNGFQRHSIASGMENLDTTIGMSRQPSFASQYGVEMSQQPSFASHMSAEMSRQPSFSSQHSAQVSREGSYSSQGQISNKDSGYGSNRTTPKEQNAASPFEAPTKMMPNQRVPKNVEPRQLRSAKSSGPADLDDPAVHIARLAKR